MASSTWTASSRVGTRMSARTGWRAGEKLVLACSPQPVEDRQRERGRLAGAGLRRREHVAPCNTSGMAAAWTGVGLT